MLKFEPPAADLGAVRAERWRSASICVAVAVATLSVAPAAEAAAAKPHPQSHSTKAPHKKAHSSSTFQSRTATSGSGTPARHGKSPKKATSPATAGPSTSRADTESPGAGSAGGYRAEFAPPAPKPTAPATSAPSHHNGGNWNRVDTGNADRGVVRAFTAGLANAGKSAGFPALLIAVVAVFLLVQHRLDKRDVKLSNADWVSDQGLEFSAPSTIRR